MHAARGTAEREVEGRETDRDEGGVERDRETEREAERRSRTNSPTEKRRNQRKPSSAEHKSSSSLPRAMSFLFSSEIRLLSGNPQYNSSHRAMQDLSYPFKCIVSS